MTTIKVKTVRQPKIKVNTSNTGQIQASNPVTVSSVIPGGARLDGLFDVDPDGEVDGAVPVYDASLDKYIVKHLDIGQVNGTANVDGGTF